MGMELHCPRSVFTDASDLSSLQSMIDNFIRRCSKFRVVFTINLHCRPTLTLCFQSRGKTMLNPPYTYKLRNLYEILSQLSTTYPLSHIFTPSHLPHHRLNSKSAFASFLHCRLPISKMISHHRTFGSKPNGSAVSNSTSYFPLPLPILAVRSAIEPHSSRPFSPSVFPSLDPFIHYLPFPSLLTLSAGL